MNDVNRRVSVPSSYVLDNSTLDEPETFITDNFDEIELSFREDPDLGSENPRRTIPRLMLAMGDSSMLEENGEVPDYNPTAVRLNDSRDLGRGGGTGELFTKGSNVQLGYQDDQEGREQVWEPGAMVVRPPTSDSEVRYEEKENAVHEFVDAEERLRKSEDRSGGLVLENTEDESVLSSPADARDLQDIAADIGGSEHLDYALDTGAAGNEWREFADAMDTYLEIMRVRNTDSYGASVGLYDDEGVVDVEDALSYGNLDVTVHPDSYDEESVRESSSFS